MLPIPSAKIKELVRRRPLIMAIVLGVIAMLFIAGYLKRREAELLFIADPIDVIVVKEDVAEGAMINTEQIEKKEVPRAYVQPGAIKRSSDAIGLVSRMALTRGVMLTHEMVVSPGTESGVVPALSRGVRALSIAVDEVTGVAGLIRPGDRVDILASFDFGDAATSRSSTFVLAQSIPILAVGSRMSTIPRTKQAEDPSQGLLGGVAPMLRKESANSTITLAVSPSDAQAIVFAQESGSITIAARARGDDHIENLPPATVEMITGATGLMRQHKPSYREYRGR